LKYILTGGGTGGHVYPALAISEEIRKRYPQSECIYIGIRGKAEEKILSALPALKIRFIKSRGLPTSKFSFQIVTFFITLFIGVLQSFFILRKFKPDLIVGTGGYVTVPVMIAGRLLGCRLFIHEQNAVPGLANRVLGRIVNTVGVTFEKSKDYFPAGKVSVSGYPLRKNIKLQNKEKVRKKLGIPPESKVVFIFGGSQGAKTINEVVVTTISRLLKEKNLMVIHGTGRFKSSYYNAYEDTIRALKEKEINGRLAGGYIVRDYFDPVSDIYSASDLVVSRAGAGTIMELSSLGLPAILIPKPGLPGDHQTYNARLTEDTGGALMMKETAGEKGSFINGEEFVMNITSLIFNVEKLKEMSLRIEKIIDKDSLSKIGDLIESLINRRNNSLSPFAVLRMAQKDEILPEFTEKGKKYLKSKNWKVKNIGVKLVGILDMEERIPDLLDIIHDRTPAPFIQKLFGGDFMNVGFIRRNAVLSLISLNKIDNDIRGALSIALKDPYWEVKTTALQAYAQLEVEKNYKDIKAKVLDLISDKNFEVAAAAVACISQISADPEIITALRKIYYHPNRRVKIELVNALKRLHDRGVIKEEDALYCELDQIFIPELDIKRIVT